MLIGNLPWFAVAAVSVAFLQTTEAAPIRVTVVSQQEWLQLMGGGPPPPVLRFGHAMANTEGRIVPGPISPSGPKKPCPMHRGGPKNGMSLSDSLRKALGLPPVEPQPMQLTRIEFKPDEAGVMVPVQSLKPVAPHMDHGIAPQKKSNSFLERLHAAVMALGDGEARIVAFVLGCGIGVLLRMLWVFFVLIGRGLREASTPSQDAEYTLVLQDEEQLPKYEAQPPTAQQLSAAEKEKALFKALEEAGFI